MASRFIDSSLYGLVKRVYDLRLNAIVQQQAILLGGEITDMEGQNDSTPHLPVRPDGSGLGPGAASRPFLGVLEPSGVA